MTFIPSLTIPQLGLGAGYVLWGFRAAALAHTDCPALKKGFERALGEDSERAAECIDDLVHSIRSKGGRRITLGEPGCCGVTTDELSIVALIASAQQQDFARRDAHLRWLMGGHGEDRARLAADTIGALFLTAGMSIYLPEIEVVDRTGGQPFQTYHEVGHA